ncbi:peptide chain release factor N(5)-glutamine methyltransferase [Pelagibacteraceae bacterium]|nr:peptide chain release factor N(5)-glutamine methyltransferase [Pelagibacteraceae bacterium]
MNDFILDNLKKLQKHKIPNPEIDLRILLNYSKLLQNEIILSNFNINQINIKKFNIMLNRRLSNEPISKIINKKSFWKDDFYVNEFVLDPRPETEIIIEESQRIFNNKKAYIKILDIGTGSGAIAISLAREFENAEILAIDISEDAIKVADKNIRDKKLHNRIQLKKTTINYINENFDLIVSNPPYLTKKELENISQEIRKFEPFISLDGGEDGLNFYRKFAKKIPQIMNSSAYLIIEIGAKQYVDCREIFKFSSLKLEKKTQDLQKKDRIMVFSKI